MGRTGYSCCNVPVYDSMQCFSIHNETTKAAESSAETTAAEAGDKEESGEAVESAAEGDLVATADYPTRHLLL